MSPVPDVGQVPRKAPRNDKHGIDPNGVAGPGKAGRQSFRGHCHPPQSIFVQCPGGCILRPALLHLDERDGSAAPCDQIDFTARDPRTLGENVPAIEAQPPSGNCLRPTSSRFSPLTIQSLPPSSSALE